MSAPPLSLSPEETQELSQLLLTFTRRIVPLERAVRANLVTCAKRGDVHGLRLWRARHAQWQELSSLIKSRCPARTREELAALKADLATAIGLTNAWSIGDAPTTTS